MRVKIIKCSDKSWWYNDEIGNTFLVDKDKVFDGCYNVSNTQNEYKGWIWEIDCEEIIESEKEVLNKLADAWNLFLKLERQHPSECDDFADGIHKCQYVIAMRIARKHEPDIFPIKK